MTKIPDLTLIRSPFKKQCKHVKKRKTGGVGFSLEKYFSQNCICPICKNQTLRQMKNNNTPFIDFKCISGIHSPSKPNYFQLKSKKQKGSYFSKNRVPFGKSEFSNRVIKSKPGTSLHRFLPGYICVSYTESGKKIHINNESFVVIPDMTKKSFIKSGSGLTWKKGNVKIIPITSAIKERCIDLVQ